MHNSQFSVKGAGVGSENFQVSDGLYLREYEPF